MAIVEVTSAYDYLYNPETNEVVVWTDEEAGFGAEDAILTISFEAVPAGRNVIGFDIVDATGVDSDWTIVNSVDGVVIGLAVGDITMDGEISNADVVALARYLVDIVEFNEKELELADYSGDGKITNSDLIKLVRYIVELDPANP